MSLRARAAAVVCAVTLAPTAVTHAAHPTGTITLTGSRTAYAWLTVKRTVTYDPDAATVKYDGGRWAGFAIDRDRAVMWTSYVVYSGGPIMLGGSWTYGVLKPGRYKVRLFTDGQPVTVKIPWSGADVTLDATGPVSATIQAGRVEVPGTGSTVALSFPQDGRIGSNAIVAAHLDAVISPSYTLQLCLGRRRDTCEGAVYRLTAPGAGTVLNGDSIEFGLYNRQHPTKGLYARGQITGTAVGLLTVLSLRFNP